MLSRSILPQHHRMAERTAHTVPTRTFVLPGKTPTHRQGPIVRDHANLAFHLRATISGRPSRRIAQSPRGPGRPESECSRYSVRARHLDRVADLSAQCCSAPIFQPQTLVRIGWARPASLATARHPPANWTVGRSAQAKTSFRFKRSRAMHGLGSARRRTNHHFPTLTGDSPQHRPLVDRSAHGLPRP